MSEKEYFYNYLECIDVTLDKLAGDGVRKGEMQGYGTVMIGLALAELAKQFRRYNNLEELKLNTNK